MTEKIEKIMFEVNSFIRDAEKSIDSAAPIDFDEFEIKLKEFNAELAKLPKEQAEIYQPSLKTWISTLNQIQDRMKTNLELLRQKMNDASSHKSAALAYINQPKS
jgi:ElaB/YqjD/DUF883 family membrane-anchored ribosome-binding protein